MSSKRRWVEGAKHLMKPNANCVGPRKVPSQSSCDHISQAQTGSVEATTIAPISTQDHSQLELLKALICAQRQTIDNYQKDLVIDRTKSQVLEAQIKSLQAELKSREDYNAVKLENKLGYQGGYEKGMAKVKMGECFHVVRFDVYITGF